MAYPKTGVFRVDLALAVCDKIVSLGKVPTGALATTVNPGATGIDLTSANDAANFAEQGKLTWWDGIDEYPLTIDSVTGAHIEFDWSGEQNLDGSPRTGLTYTHEAGATVATNIVPAYRRMKAQASTNTMLSSTWPVIRVWSEDGVDTNATLAARQQRMAPTAAAYVCYQLRSVQPGSGPRADSDNFAYRQARRSETDLQAIKVGLKDDDTRLGGILDVILHFAQKGREADPGQDMLYEQRLDVFARGLQY